MMKHGTRLVTRRESELIHAALRIELADVIAVAKETERDGLIVYLKELRRQIGQCDERACRVNRRALALVRRNRSRK